MTSKVGGSTANKAVKSTIPPATNTAEAWARRFLQDIGAPVTQNNIDNIIRWGIAESGSPGHNQGHGGWTNFNPLNVVVQENDNHTGQGGTQGNIADFGNVQDGADASARLFLNNNNAGPIIAALKANGAVSQLNGAINSFYSSWGGSINITGISPSGGSTSLGSGQAVQTTSLWTDFTGAVESGLFPGGPIAKKIFDAFGGASNTVKGINTTLGWIVNVFSNWRYVVELFAGLSLILIGGVMLLVSTGVVGKAAQVAPAVAAVAA